MPPAKVTPRSCAYCSRKGVDPNAVYRNDLTALMWAAGYGRTETVRALIGAGARVELVDDRGKARSTWRASSSTSRPRPCSSRRCAQQTTDHHSPQDAVAAQRVAHCGGYMEGDQRHQHPARRIMDRAHSVLQRGQLAPPRRQRDAELFDRVAAPHGAEIPGQRHDDQRRVESACVLWRPRACHAGNAAAAAADAQSANRGESASMRAGKGRSTCAG